MACVFVQLKINDWNLHNEVSGNILESVSPSFSPDGIF